MTESADLSELSGPGPNLAQVNPPHPFKAAIKTVVNAAIVMIIAIGAMFTWTEVPVRRRERC